MSISTTVNLADLVPRNPHWNKIGDTWPMVHSRCDCEKACDGWKLTGCSTTLDITVSIKNGLPPQVESFARRAESDHVGDFFAAGFAMVKAGGDEERKLKIRTWPSKFNCESESLKAIVGLTESIAKKYAKWSERWDVPGGPHEYRSP